MYLRESTYKQIITMKYRKECLINITEEYIALLMVGTTDVRKDVRTAVLTPHMVM